MKLGLGLGLNKGLGGGDGGDVSGEYYTDFTEYTTDETPSDWVPVMYEQTIRPWEVDSSDRLWRNEAVTEEEDGIYWDIAPVGVEDLDVILETLVAPANTSTSGRTRLMARFAAGFSTSVVNMLNDAGTNGYLLELFQGDDVRILRVIDGVVTVLDTAAFVHAGLTLYRMKFQLIGDQLKGRVWEDGDPEPETWNVESTDATFNSGFYGISTRRIQRYHDFKLTVL